MANGKLRRTLLEGAWGQVEHAMFRVPLMVLFVLGMAAVQRDASLLGLAAAMWAFVYLFAAPTVVARVGYREPPGDRWRAAAWVAYGGTPTPLFLAPGLIGWPWGFASIPIAMAVGVTAWIMAMRETPPPQSPRVRAVMMAGASVLMGLVCLPLFGGAVVGFLMGVWDPPAIAWLAAPVVIGLCLPLAIGAAYAGVSLFGEAARAWRLSLAPDGG